MRALLAAAALFLTALAAVPVASADPILSAVCLDSDTGDSWCFLSSTSGYTCVQSVERSQNQHAGIGCVTVKPSPEACAVATQDGQTLCVRV